MPGERENKATEEGVDDNIKRLKRRRAGLKGNLTKFQNKFAELKASNNLAQIKARFVRFEKLLEEFEHVQEQIEEIEENEEGNIQERNNFEEFYYSLVNEVETFLAIQAIPMAKHQENTQSEMVDRIVSSTIRLPRIEIPKFDGKYEEWTSFIDLFNAMVHNNTSISGAQKLLYLSDSLIGDAKEVIRFLNITSDNYPIAMDMLKTRYEKRQLIISAHIKSLFDLPQMTRDSSQELRKLISSSKQHLRSIDAMKLPTADWDPIIIVLLKRKLDSTTSKQWELEQRDPNKMATLVQLYEFLERRCYALEASSINYRDNKQGTTRLSKFTSHIAANKHEIKEHICKLCSEPHYLYACNKFIQLPLQDKINQIKATGACFNCLRPGHAVKMCRMRHCKKCNGKHHTIIHQDRNTADSQDQETTQTTISSNSIVLNSLAGNSYQVLLATVSVEVRTKEGKWIRCRALLDSASQSSFITKEFANRIQCNIKNVETTIQGISGSETKTNGMVKIQLKSRISKYNKQLDCIVLEKITETMPAMAINHFNWKIPNVELADPSFGKPGCIDLLIGAELYCELFRGEHIKLGSGLPTLQNTVFGWIISGKVKISQDVHSAFCHLSTRDLHKQIEKFWEAEEFENMEHFTREEEKCETHFKNTYYRNKSGRFVVKLPLKEDEKYLGKSFETAMKRQQLMERKMEKNPDLRTQYTAFMNEYLELNHMSEVTIEHNDRVNYLPHHAVIKEESLTTKLRVVFDGSAKTSSGVSLNEMLLVGPRLLPDLKKMLIRFREHTFVIAADIEKMYRQIIIHPDDRDLQRILWRKDPSLEIKAYQLNTVTYGLASSPFHAIRCIRQLAIDNKELFPKASTAIKNDIYVDDLLTGGHTIDEVQQIKQEIEHIMQGAQFKLRKWKSNHFKLIEHTEDSPDKMLIDHSTISRILGLAWHSKKDVICYSVDYLDDTSTTKRQILSQIAKLFDPLGLLAPIILKAKLVMQQLWCLKLDWDHRLPQEIITEWETFKGELVLINTLEIPRHVMQPNRKQFEIHAFADASERGMGAAVYIRSYDNGTHCVRLVSAKSKVAPLKRQSLPRLELCAALLAARLCNMVQDSFTTKVKHIFLWSDSTITLYWIGKEPSQLKTFVGNRVAEIQSITSTSTWRYIPSHENPADMVSRGTNPQNLISSSLWWNGPEFLKRDQSEWPFNIVELNVTEQDTEEKIISLFADTKELKCDLLRKYSSWPKMVRIIAYCLRFIQAIKRNSSKSRSITVEELELARLSILRMVQEDTYQDELHTLKRNQYVKTNSSLKMLNPFFDQQVGLIRVGGRLKKSSLSPDQKFPIVLPAHNFITELILLDKHYKLDHCGPEQLLAVTKLQYWPISGRHIARKITRSCVKCVRYKPSVPEYIMADLPIERISPSRPFTNAGLDYAGPLYIREARRRGRYVPMKAYLAVFICLSTKAIHLELVTSLTSEAFLCALKRFISRRGLCSKLYSDNGTNFTAANNELKEIYEFLKTNHEYLHIKLSDLKIEWHFIPPRAPHFGGIWEAAVRSFKKHFYKITHNLRLTFEECYTIITEIEAILNSRPLIPSSTDPNDLSYLCPSHFLIGDYLLEPPAPNYVNISDNKLSMYQHIEKLKQHFWQRWTQEYLQQLQCRTKWQRGNHEMNIGKLVILIEDHIPPLHWKLGRIVATHPGADGVIRVVTVKTSAGVYKRPVKKLCPLPE